MDSVICTASDERSRTKLRRRAGMAARTSGNPLLANAVPGWLTAWPLASAIACQTGCNAYCARRILGPASTLAPPRGATDFVDSATAGRFARQVSRGQHRVAYGQQPMNGRRTGFPTRPCGEQVGNLSYAFAYPPMCSRPSPLAMTTMPPSLIVRPRRRSSSRS
jgi:hypothetical protein